MGVIIDPIADMLTRIKNSNQRKHKDVTMPYSKIKEDISNILQSEGFVISFKISGTGKDKKITITLKYKGTQRVITGIKRISKPGLRVYTSSQHLPKVLSGFGTAIISTSNGIITDKEARKVNIGGEVIAYVW